MTKFNVLESLLFAEILCIFGMLHGWIFKLSLFHYNCLNSFVAGFGEEAVFRAGLFAFLVWLFPNKRCIFISAIITSLLFSGAHYWPGGDCFRWSSFMFRFWSGMWFAFIFSIRGYWTAGLTHSFYDLLVTVMQ